MTESLLIVATSLDPQSRSQRLARAAQQEALALGLSPDLIDLREWDLPLAGSAESWNHQNVQALKDRVQHQKRLLLCVPIYNYDVNAAAKNLIELLGGPWLENGVVGFICTAGGKASYMSVMGFANSLMLDFRAWIVPRIVYAIDEDWQEEKPNKDLKIRIRQLLSALCDGPCKT